MDLRNWEMFVATGGPVVGANVSVYEASLTHPNAGAAITTTTTNGSGMWEFTGLTNTAKDVKVEYSGRTKWYKGLTLHSVYSIRENAEDTFTQQNLLENGGLDDWNLGTTGSLTTSYVEILPRWLAKIGTGDVCTYAANAAGNDSLFAGQFVYTRSAGDLSVKQTLPVVRARATRGHALSFSVLVHQTVASMSKAYIDDGVTKTYSSTSATTGSFVVLTVANFSVSASATKLEVGVEGILSGTLNIDSAMLNFGTTALSWTANQDDDDFTRAIYVPKGVAVVLPFGSILRGKTDGGTDENIAEVNASEQLIIGDATFTAIRLIAASDNVLVDGSPVWTDANTTDRVTTAKILNANVTTAKIADLNVTTAKLANDNVTTGKIADNAVTTVKIPDSNVTEAKIADLAVTAGKIANGTVTNAKLDTGAVTTDKITNLAVTTVKVDDLAITAGKLAADAVETAKIKDGNVTAGKLATDAVETLKIKDLNVTTAKLVDNAVTTAKITDLNVTEAKLANDAVTAAKIAANAVGSSELADNAVDTAAIAALAVTAAKMATDSVATANVQNGAITDAKLALAYIQSVLGGGNQTITFTGGSIVVGQNAVGAGSHGLKVNGDSTTTGLKARLATGHAGDTGIFHAQESPVPYFEEFGRDRLLGSKVTVRIPEDYANFVDLSDYHVYLTPEGPASLYVAERHPRYFVVRLLVGDRNTHFSWRLVARQGDLLDVERLGGRRAPDGTP